MKSRHRKVGHTPTRAHTHWRVEGKPLEKNGAWQPVESCFPTGFPPMCRSASCISKSKVSDRRRAGRKSQWRQGDPTTAVAVKRSDGGGFREENKVTERKHDHRKKKLGFPFWL